MIRSVIVTYSISLPIISPCLQCCLVCDCLLLSLLAGTVLLVVIAHSWDFDLHKRVAIAHFMITDDLSKGNIQVTYFLEHLVQHYNNKYRAWGQPLIKTLITTSDNCAAQFRSRYHFAWMVDFAEESESVSTVLAIYLAEYHGKGPADSAAGGAKTKADEAAVYGTTIETAYDLFLFLNAHYKEVTHQIVFQFVQTTLSNILF